MFFLSNCLLIQFSLREEKNIAVEHFIGAYLTSYFSHCCNKILGKEQLKGWTAYFGS